MQTIQHGAGQRRIAIKGVFPVAERQVRSEDHRALLVALGHNLEEQVRLILFQRR